MTEPYYVYRAEAEALESLRRFAPNYDVRLPDTNKPLDWLALLQHHGGASRLLDFTKSYFVAAFFALEAAEGDSAIWAINRFRLTHAAFEVLNPGKLANEHFDCDGDEDRFIETVVDTVFSTSGVWPVVIPVHPAFANDRMVVQQGAFLMTTDAAHPFDTALADTFSGPRWLPRGDHEVEYQSSARYWKHSEPWSSTWSAIKNAGVIKIVIPASSRLAGLRQLDEMNVTAASLFPGFDGLARSLRRVTYDSALTPEESDRLQESLIGFWGDVYAADDGDDEKVSQEHDEPAPPSTDRKAKLP